MAKAIISNRIYLDDPGQEHTKHIIKSLTYKIERDTGSKKFSNIETIKNYKVLPRGILSIPQGRKDLIPEHYEIVDRRVLNPVPFPTANFDLRQEQLEIYDKVTDTCFINALVGWGKTFTALHIAKKLGQKTLVITHTTALRDQWIEEVEQLFSMEVGVIGSGKFDIEDHAVVIGNVQSIVKHIDKIQKEFGTVILDEAHHCPATTFASIVDSMHSRYRIGLSGTMIRKDKKHIVFNDYFGDIVYRPPQSNTLNPTVKILKPGITLKPDATWVDKITQLTQDDDYRRFIASIALTQMSQGHSVLIVADRVEFLEKVQEYVGEKCLLVTGNTSYEERNRAKEELLSKEKLCVAGSRQIFAEGISINILSCVVLAVPMSNDSLLEQIVGRIMRQHPDKPNPLVIDIHFSGRADRKQNNDRLSLYLRKGWDVVTV